MRLGAAHHALAPPIPHHRNDGFDTRTIEAVERSCWQIIVELAAVGGELRLEIVEHRLRQSEGICRRLQHKRRHGADVSRLRHAAFAVAREIVHPLAAACGMADMDRILQVEMRGHRREVVSIMVHVMAVAGLRRAAMPAPVMRDDAITLAQEEQHLRVPVVGRQRPAMTEYDWLTRTPILVKDLDAILCLHRRHGLTLSLIERLQDEHDAGVSGTAPGPLARTRYLSPALSPGECHMGEQLAGSFD